MLKLDPVVLRAKIGANPAVKARFERVSDAKEAQERREQQARELAERQAKEEAARAAAKEEAARAAAKAAAEAARAAAATEKKIHTHERATKGNKKPKATQVSGERAQAI